MAEYKGIHGTKIQNYTTDPDNPITGQVWYNETDQVMKFQYPTTIAAWSTGGNLSTARRALRGAGTQTAALAFGGITTAVTGVTESYDGTSWTEVNDLTTARQNFGSAGIQTSALAFGGYTGTAYTGVTESWNGTSWTEVADLNNNRGYQAGAGVDNTSALSFGGYLTASSG